ncbi:MAG TPA: YbjQ family protein [Polyangia bacterium]|nr:YbjQ family protein [Polyangia bacterium]
MAKDETAGHPYRVGAEVTEEIVVTTANDVEGHRIARYLGVVRGIVVRSPSLGKAFVGAFRSLGGGNIKEYVEVCEAARHDAYRQMVEHARELGAAAIVGMRYDATEFMQGATEVLAYGTAVTLDRVV